MAFEDLKKNDAIGIAIMDELWEWAGDRIVEVNSHTPDENFNYMKIRDAIHSMKQCMASHVRILAPDIPKREHLPQSDEHQEKHLKLVVCNE